MPGTALARWSGEVPASPSGFGSAVPPALPPSSGATFYVAPDTGSDSNAGTTREAPWETLAHAASSVAPGDTVLLEPGTYPAGTSITVRGEPDAPITIAADEGAVVTLPSLGLADSSYARVTRLVFDGALGATAAVVSTGAASHHIEISLDEIRGGPVGGIYVAGSDHRIVANHVHHNGTKARYGDGVQVLGLRTLVAGNAIHDNVGHGVLLYGGTSDAIGTVCTGNTVVANAQSGISFGERSSGNLAVNDIVSLHMDAALPGSGMGFGVAETTGPGNAVRRSVDFDNIIPVTDAPPRVHVYDDVRFDDPMLRSPAAGDLRLMGTSPAVDQGLDEWGVSPDADGSSRPAGIIDLGAYELP